MEKLNLMGMNIEPILTTKCMNLSMSRSMSYEEIKIEKRSLG